MDEIKEFYKLNSYQTPLTEELKKSLPKEVWLDLIEFITSIQFIKNIVLPENERGFAKDVVKSKDFNDGRIEVDITKPHVLENMDFFRERALFFEKHGRYTNLTPNPNPKSTYAEFWKEELRRWKYGLVRPSDGEWIPGELYFYWNYSPIWLVETIGQSETSKKSQGERVRKFAKPWLGDYLFHHYVEQCKRNGKHGKLLKTRGCGMSFKAASWSPRNMYVLPGSGNPNFHLASDKSFLTGDKGIWGKILDNLDWVAEHTPLPRMRLVDRMGATLDVQLGFKDEYGSRKGLLSSVTGISLKDAPEKARGIRGPLIHYEEDGLFPNLETAWNVNRKAVEDGNTTFGFMIAAGTGGTSGASFEGSEKLFYNPGGYNIRGLKNVFDKNTKGDTYCGFFWGAYLNRKDCFEEINGEPDIIKALIEILEDRFQVKYNSTDPLAITQKKAEEPCITGDTLISNYSIGADQIINFNSKFSNGIKPVYNFKLKSGRSINCTANHKIFNGENYYQASDYNIGDVVKLKPLICNTEYQKLNINGEFNFDNYNITIDEDWGRFIGLYMGDGSFYNNTLRVDFDKRDVNSYMWLESFLNSKFGRCSIINYDFKNQVSIELTSVYLKKLFIDLDLIKKWNGNKHGYKRKIHVPNYIFKSPKSVIAEYLKGYFDADSGIYTQQKNIKIYSKELNKLLSVQYLLTAFDIYTNVKSEIKKTSDHTYNGNSITLRSWEVDRFKEIGYISEHKQSLLNKWTSTESKTKLNYDFDILESFNYVGELPVYDIETEEHCYSANGIWVHNCTPQEAIMRTEGTVFPVSDLKDYLESVMVKKEAFLAEHYVGELVRTSDGKLKWRLNNDKFPLRSYDKDNANREGCLEIFEMPSTNANGEIANGRYIAGIDPIDADSGTSLFSIQVMDLFTDRIVAEFSGRPRLAEEAYEISLRLLEFYNAVANYEKNLKGLFSYFDKKNALFRLCDTPQILKDMQMTKDMGYGNTSKGTMANAEVNKWGRKLQADWMNTSIEDEENPGKLKLHTLRGLAYIEECIKWNSDGNFDRVSAGGMLFILREDRYKQTQSAIANKDKQVETLANDKFFNRNFNKPNAMNGTQIHY